MDEPQTLPRESARQRALRIPLNYHRARTGLGLTRLALTILLVVIGSGYLAWVLYGGRSAATQLSPGMLASAHARWENDCRACHLPLTPVRSDSAASRSAGVLLGGAHESADARCSACHKGAGPHHASQFAAEVGSCASCHREHQGKQAPLSQMSDQECTRCHESIASHRRTEVAHSGDAAAPVKDVSSFALAIPGESQPHPKFRSLELPADPGNIRFSHRLHMAAGQLYPGQSPSPGRKLVQLKCDSCHQDSPAPLGGGAYMQPISFVKHCQSCHPLQVPGKETAIPHGLKGPQLEAFIAGTLAAEKKTKAQAPPRLIPGKTRLEKDKQEALQPPPTLVAASHLQQLRANSCSKCHSWQQEQPTEVVPASIPLVWLKGARFNHASHRAAAKCQDCHPQAYESASSGPPGRLADDERVMIPDIDNCARCHAPKNDAAGSGGARYDCAECHRYHNVPATPTANEKSFAFHTSNPKSQIPSPKSPVRAAHPFVGTQSCSAAACHGANTGTDLATSFTRFTAADPHTGAFLLLYTPSSLDIYRRFTSQPQATLEGAAYFRFIQEKCIGCHATPLADPAAAELVENNVGVTCESCHGAAEKWEFAHFNRKDQASPRPTDLTNPSLTAKVCAECHIGPQQVAGKSYDVNHDLIAAGHPRLTFAFEAQFANLPAHWSAAKEIKSHFEAWRLGELATAAQQDKLDASRAAPEFASHRCFDCHHSLTPKSAASRITFPPLTAIGKEQREWLANPAPSRQAQAGVLLKLLNRVTDSRNSSSTGTRWEEHVWFSLALSAYVADNPRSGELSSHADSLRAILTNSFRSLPLDRKLKQEGTFAGGHYDSPTGFEPEGEKLQQVLEDIRASLTAP